MKTIGKIALLMSLINVLFANDISFKELTTLASQDLNKSIFLDKDIPKYNVEFNQIDYQVPGQIYEFYKIVLFDNNLSLQYNRAGNFYFIKNVKVKPKLEELPPVLLPTKKDRLNYYVYKINNITNEDVVEAMSIFEGIRYKYLKQSDMIAYSATKRMHKHIHSVLVSTDRTIVHKVIKLTMFSVNKDRLKSVGSTISAFNFTFDSKIGHMLESLSSSVDDSITFNSSANIKFTLQAMQSHKVIDIYQKPTIRITNGIESIVTSVLNIPYLKTSSQVDANTQQITEEYDYKDVGLQIKVLPKIKDNLVFIDLDLISDELISLDDNKPITQKITYKSSFKVHQGKPILLTGIKKTSQHLERSGVPILEDIPIIGALFRFKEKKTEERNINILIEVI